MGSYESSTTLSLLKGVISYAAHHNETKEETDPVRRNALPHRAELDAFPLGIHCDHHDGHHRLFNAAAALRNRGQHTGQRTVHNAGFPHEPD